MYTAKILADSIANGVRLVTMEVTFPRFILAEFNTHRVFSRNSASSRAIPVHKRIAQVWSNPFVPESFGLNKSGMQASANLGGWRASLARWLWVMASRFCVLIAWAMSKIDVHKQLANRVIELWAWHTVVVTATEWENFFNLRTHKAAQPEMQITARRMREAFDASTPRELQSGEWHLPYVDEEEKEILRDKTDDLVKISVVRCAAVSFERQYAARTINQCITRHDEMRSLAHWSPFEHQAKVATHEEQKDHASWSVCDHPEAGEQLTAGFMGNLRAPWLQYRKTFQGEEVWTAE